MPKEFLKYNGERTKLDSSDYGFFWIKGEAIVREKMYPYDRNQRVEFGNYDGQEMEAIPIYVSNGYIDMGNDIMISVEWLTAKTQVWGPVVMIPPWQKK